MVETYTYTARSANNPNRMATLTLHNQHLFVDFGGSVLEQVEPQSPTTGEEEASKIPPWVQPTGIWLAQQKLQPFQIADVGVRAPGDGLQISAWIRARGLRLAPVIFYWSQVDNPEAAQAFANELNKRKETAEYSGRFPGLLDYWATWIVAGAALVGFAWRWLRQKDNPA